MVFEVKGVKGKSASVRRPFTKMTWRPRFCQGKTAKILGSKTIFKIQMLLLKLTFEFIQYTIKQWSEVLLTSRILLEMQTLRSKIDSEEGRQSVGREATKDS